MEDQAISLIDGGPAQIRLLKDQGKWFAHLLGILHASRNMLPVFSGRGGIQTLNVFVIKTIFLLCGIHIIRQYDLQIQVLDLKKSHIGLHNSINLISHNNIPVDSAFFGL